MLHVGVDDELLQTEGELWDDVLEEEGLHVTRTEHPQPGLEDEFG